MLFANILTQCSKIFAAQVRHYQVTVAGGTTDIGQTLSLLLRTEPRVDTLVLQDSHEKTPGLVLDLSHIPAPSLLKAYVGNRSLSDAVMNSQLVLAVGGTTLQPGVSNESCLEANVEFIKNLAITVSRTIPLPFFGIATQPVNCIVPLVAEIMKLHGYYDSRKLFGITEIDALRAKMLLASEFQIPAGDVFLPVIGGHSNETMVPLLSQATPQLSVEPKDVFAFTNTLRRIDQRPVLKKRRGWPSNLSQAYGVFLFAKKILDVLDGKESVVNAYVENNLYGTDFFSGPVKVKRSGYYESYHFSELMKNEHFFLKSSINQLHKDITLGRRILQME